MKSRAGAKLRVKVMSAEMDILLKSICALNCRILNVSYEDPLTIHFSLGKSDFRKLRPELEKRGYDYSVREETKTCTPVRIFSRPVFLAGTILLLALTVFLPRRVLFITTTGNSSVPATLILEKAQQCGVEFGCMRGEIRSEAVKNHLLKEIPELQWAGVNTEGCVATICVREKARNSAEQDGAAAVSSIVAARDGRIISCTVLRGSSKCVPGQTVTAGELLVSGYTDCGIYLQATDAAADVLAQTFHRLSVVTPRYLNMRVGKSVIRKRYSLRIGKKLINFSKDSGIPDTTCVKIQKETMLRLPGGFSLPVALIREDLSVSEIKRIQIEDIDWLSQFANSYLTSQMVAGRILSADESLAVSDGSVYLYGSYNCTEMIGKNKQEGISTAYGNDGTYS